MGKFLTYILFLVPLFVFGQYPFEKYKSPKCQFLAFKMMEKTDALEFSSMVTSFFEDKSALEVIAIGSSETNEESYIQVLTNLNNKKHFEEIQVREIEGLYIADYNGDGKKDFKIVCYTTGCGLASMNVRVIYFFQKENKEFTKLSFDDKMDGQRWERDLNGDGNFEIITMTLQEHKNHNYWLFNVYNFENDNLICVNNKFKYPIMIQYLYRDNYKITTKITRNEMQKYEMKRPKEMQIEN